MYDLYCGSSNSLSVGIIAQRRFIVASNIQSNVVYYYEKLFQASLKTLEYVGPLYIGQTRKTDYILLLCHIL